MPMGIVSDKDFEKEVDNSVPSKESPVTTVIEPINRGRGAGNVEVPDSLRAVIGDEAITNGRQSAVELATRFGISPSSASAYGVGATSTSSYAERPNGKVIKEAKERIAKRARGKLMRALNKITDDKLESANAKDLAGIAKDMSAIVKTMEPDDRGIPQNNNGPTFVFYAPQMRSEEQYAVVHTKE
jgi:hypothetical protein